MSIQDKHDKFYFFTDMKKSSSFYLLSTKRLSWEQTDWKIKKGIGSDDLGILRDPESLPDSKSQNTKIHTENGNNEKKVRTRLSYKNKHFARSIVIQGISTLQAD